jgi:hypothetical protein
MAAPTSAHDRKLLISSARPIRKRAGAPLGVDFAGY